MKVIVGILLVLLALIQYEFWFSDGGMRTVWKMKRSIAKQEKVNASLETRNALLLSQIKALQSGDAAIEARARNDLGMVKEGEVYFRVVNKQ